ncbi:glycosyltransferase [Glaciecola siphonariae]|uniref:Glycosyltransferase n=1 Tax=Glaciecola siphonariae TaxID=521012 RepID=A0ABV9LWC2_9ALTE
MMPNNAIRKTSVMHITYDMRIGGTEMVIKNIIEAADTERFNMSIFCIEAPLGPWGSALEQAGISINTHARKPGFDLRLISAIRRHIKLHNIDILHCHQYTPWVYGALASIGLPTRVIFTEHGRFYPDSSSWKRRIINPVLSGITQRITAISKATKTALAEFEYIPEHKVKVIYNGIDGLAYNSEKSGEIKHSLNLSGASIIFGTIARLDPIKNHDMMLRAFAQTLTVHPNAKLIIIGDGELKAHLLKLCDSLKIREYVIFTGYIPYPKDYLALFDVFLLSSLSEGTSMTLLEAMSLGKPCVVTDAGGNKEIVIHEQTGLVSANNDMEGFADNLIRVATNKHQMIEYGKNASARFNEQFTSRAMFAEYRHCYDGEPLNG